MPHELSEIERMTLSAIAAFPIAVFEGPVVDRLIGHGMVTLVEGELRVSEAGRRVLQSPETGPVMPPAVRETRKSVVGKRRNRVTAGTGVARRA
jgi:hypothetical protein